MKTIEVSICAFTQLALSFLISIGAFAQNAKVTVLDPDTAAQAKALYTERGGTITIPGTYCGGLTYSAPTVGGRSW